MEFTWIDYGSKYGSFYVGIDESTGELWIDLNMFPKSCFLCACCDGIPLVKMKLKKRYVYALPFKWVAYEWGTDKILEDALREKYDHLSKHWEELISCDHERFKELAAC